MIDGRVAAAELRLQAHIRGADVCAVDARTDQRVDDGLLTLTGLVHRGGDVRRGELDRDVHGQRVGRALHLAGPDDRDLAGVGVGVGMIDGPDFDVASHADRPATAIPAAARTINRVASFALAAIGMPGSLEHPSIRPSRGARGRPRTCRSATRDVGDVPVGADTCRAHRGVEHRRRVRWRRVSAAPACGTRRAVAARSGAAWCRAARSARFRTGGTSPSWSSIRVIGWPAVDEPVDERVQRDAVVVRVHHVE